MPLAGAKPQDDHRHRNPPVHEWQEVLNTPYTGDSPELPSTHFTTSRGGNRNEFKFQPMVLEWWNVLRQMPHCILWSESDWQFALATAVVADEAFAGNTGAAAELRMREKILGTTYDARRDLRIRYVESLSGDTVSNATNSNGNVATDKRRLRLLDDA